MRYKITFKASRDNDRQARDLFVNYISAIRDGLELVDNFLGIHPEYHDSVIEFEVTVTDNLLELSKDKHFKFVNRLQSALSEHIDLFECEKID